MISNLYFLSFSCPPLLTFAKKSVDNQYLALLFHKQKSFAKKGQHHNIIKKG